MHRKWLLSGMALLFIASTALAADESLKRPNLDRGLQAIVAGQQVPLGNRPLPEHMKMSDQLRGIIGTPEAVEYTAPSEYSVLFQFNGSLAELEAAGIRVQTQAGSVFTAQVRPNEVKNFTRVSGIRSLQLSRFRAPQLDSAMVATGGNLVHGTPVGSPPVYPGHVGKGMLLGDIDTGIDWKRPEFQDPTTGKTRILYIWDQTDAVGPNPGAFAYGSEWTNNDIDNTPGSVRETDTGSAGHGTNVSSCLAGNGEETGCSQPAYHYVGMAPQANLIQVKSDLSDAHILDGCNYIFQKAALLGRDCVVNMSFGGHYDAHDGSDLMSLGINAMTGPGRIVCASAGNDGADSIHAEITTTSNTVGTDKFTFRVPTYTARSGTFNDYILVTGWYDPTVTSVIRVKGPSAADTLSCAYGNGAARQLVAASSKGGKLYIENADAGLTTPGSATAQQFEIEIYDSVAANAPRNGFWEVDFVTNTGKPLGTRVDAWIYASTFGSSALTGSIYSGLDFTTTVGSPGSADSVFTVGATATKKAWHSCLQNANYSYTANPTLGDLASFSSRGPRRDGVLKPEIAAPGFGVAVIKSSFVTVAQYGTGSDVEDGTHFMAAGTSFSSPLTSGAVALYLECRPHATPSQVKRSFELNATVDGFTGAVPNNKFGYGKLNVYRAIDNKPPTCAVTSPNGAEIWTIGTVHNITWNASDSVNVDSVRIEYSIDNGATWVPIAANLGNTGSYPWTVPGPQTTQARVRVTAIEGCNNAASDLSDFAFIIAALTPVEVAGFQADPASGSVNVSWSSYLNGATTFEVRRSAQPDRNFVAISGAIKGTGANTFHFTDRSVKPSTQYYYRVAYKTGSDWTVSEAFTARTGAAQFAIHGVVPNPTTGSTRIDYEVARTGRVSVDIYNLAGQRVRNLVSRAVDPGSYSADWDGRGESGRALPAGTYFARVSLGGEARTHRIVVLH